MKKINTTYSALMNYIESQEEAEYIDTLPGSLIDDLFVSIPGGYMVCLETFLNCWSSEYTVYYYNNSETEKAYKKWNKYKDEYLKLYPEAE